jgi:hypothetical protein
VHPRREPRSASQPAFHARSLVLPRATPHVTLRVCATIPVGRGVEVGDVTASFTDGVLLVIVQPIVKGHRAITAHGVPDPVDANGTLRPGELRWVIA